ncbi:MAG: glutamine synthetase family protein [Pseudomonadota bacterium]
MLSKYALTNPLELQLDKKRDEFTRNDLIKVIEENNIERITFHYTALDGKLKELKLPIANRIQAESILAEGERVDGSSLFKGMVDQSLSDLYVVPIYKTAFLNPFDKGSLDFICRYLQQDGNFASFAMDNILGNAYRYFKETTGLELYALGELEFYLISKHQSDIFLGSRQQGYHSSAPYVKNGDILNEMVRYITQMTGCVKYAHSEVGYVEHVRSDISEIKDKRAEQFEVEFLPTPIHDAADHLVLSRWLIRNIAHKYGCVASFAPKIEEGVAGNGLHVHLQLRKDGDNIMTNDEGDLSQDALKLIGGLCKYADTLTAFGNTVSSAYLRLVPNQEAPVNICWSELNRAAMVRVPLGWAKKNNLSRIVNPNEKLDSTSFQKRQTVELRSPDGSAIIHLLLAGITMAAQWGINNQKESLKLAKDLYATGNIFKNPELLKTLPMLPKSCEESSKILLEKKELYEREGIFPASIIEYVAGVLAKEKDAKMNEVLVDLPADDRLHATRRIMHKDIHKH